MPRIKIKHKHPTIQTKDQLLTILSEHDIYATKIIPLHDGYVVLTSLEEETDKIFDTPCQNSLNESSFNALLPPDLKAKRTVLLFSVDSTIRDKSEDEIQEEIESHNDFAANAIDSVYKFQGSPIIKVTFTSSAPALKSTEQGLKMFKLRIPPYQIQKEEYIPIKTCMKCYKLGEHNTNECNLPKEYTICSECGEEGHKYNRCPNSTTKKCLNCGAAHRTLAYSCPERRKLIKEIKESNKAQKATSYSNAVSSNATPQIPFPNISTDSILKIYQCVIHSHVANAITPGSYATELNQVFKDNDFPTIKITNIPDSSKLFPFMASPNTPPQTQTNEPTPSTSTTPTRPHPPETNTSTPTTLTQPPPSQITEPTPPIPAAPTKPQPEETIPATHTTPQTPPPHHQPSPPTPPKLPEEEKPLPTPEQPTQTEETTNSETLSEMSSISPNVSYSSSTCTSSLSPQNPSPPSLILKNKTNPNQKPKSKESNSNSTANPARVPPPSRPSTSQTPKPPRSTNQRSLRSKEIH